MTFDEKELLSGIQAALDEEIALLNAAATKAQESATALQEKEQQTSRKDQMPTLKGDISCNTIILFRRNRNS